MPSGSRAIRPAVVADAVSEFVQRLRNRWAAEVVELRLFGSRARGDAHEDSDVDVLVVLEHAGWWERCQVIDLGADVGLEFGLRLSPTVFDRETWNKWRRQERALVMDAEREGIAL